MLTLPCLAQSDAGRGPRRRARPISPPDPTPGGDVGRLPGVTVEDYGDELVLTGHMEAGWYRYRMKWHFYTDGRIWPEFSFAAAQAVCTQTGHRHHAYWRFDFDLDGTPTNDVVREHATPGSAGRAFTAEASRVLGGAADPTLLERRRRRDAGSATRSSPARTTGACPPTPFSKTDALVLRYKMDEIDDGQTIVTGGCAFAFEPFVNGECVEGEDTVFWYRSGALHSAGNPFECDIVGPMLMPGRVRGRRRCPGTAGVEFEAARPNPFTGSDDGPLPGRGGASRSRPSSTTLLGPPRPDAVRRRRRPRTSGRSIRIDGRTLPAGTYVVRLRGETARGTTRVVLVR